MLRTLRGSRSASSALTTIKEELQARPNFLAILPGLGRNVGMDRGLHFATRRVPIHCSNHTRHPQPCLDGLRSRRVAGGSLLGNPARTKTPRLGISTRRCKGCCCSTGCGGVGVGGRGAPLTDRRRSPTLRFDLRFQRSRHSGRQGDLCQKHPRLRCLTATIEPSALPRTAVHSFFTVR
jgi:hypothetical protein